MGSEMCIRDRFEVDAAPSEARKTALGREIDELVRRRERDAREAREAEQGASAGAPISTQRSALEVAYV